MPQIKLAKNKSTFPLPIETAIIVPSTDKVNKRISAKKFNARTNKVRRFLSNKFGGYTSVRGFGGFTTKRGKLVKERVNVVTAYATKKSYLMNKKAFVDFAKEKKKDWNQESVGVIVENDLFFIS